MDILIVDSSRLFHQIVSSLFSGTELRPIMAGSGAEALAAAAAGRCDFVCSSYHLPDMTGADLCRHFRGIEGTRHTPFVLLTTERDDAIGPTAMAAGVTEIFHRNHLDELVTFIRRFLMQHQPIAAHILLIEDQAAQRRLYVSQLESAGMSVDAFADAPSALVAFDREAYDVVVTDIVLAGPMSGIGIVNQIRRRPDHRGETPILALTAFDDMTRRVELFHLGVNDYVLKPVLTDEFLIRVRNLVTMRRLFADLHRRTRLAQDTAATLLRAIDQVNSAVAIAGADGRIEYINPRFAALAGVTAHAAAGRPLSAFDGEDRTLPAAAETRETTKRRNDGSLYWAHESISPVRGDDGDITHYLAIHDDTSEQRELRDQIAFHARHDRLTGLFNRAEFEHRIASTIAGAHEHGTTATLALLDVCHLKLVNDSCGYEAGDALLRELGARLAPFQRDDVIAARIDSGRLALLCRGMAAAPARQLIDAALAALAAFELEWGSRHIPTEVVAGIAATQGAADSPSDLFRRADSAAHVARDSGRGHAVAYDEADPRISARHGAKQWLPLLQQALDDGRFTLFSQLIMPLKDGLATGFELLLRLRGDDGALVAPGHFLPAAEHYGLMPRIDRWVVRHALDWIARQPVEADRPFYDINISGQSLSDPTFVHDIEQWVRASGIAAETLCFEVTESVMVDSEETALGFLATMRGLGCRFSLDDFGSGFASYGQLRRLPVQQLKIDGQFVRHIAGDAVSRAMVKSMGDVGRVMGMETVAEFVEDEATLLALREIGIDYAQGYHLGRPAPLPQ